MMQGTYLRQHLAPHDQNNRKVMYHREYFLYHQKNHILHLLPSLLWLHLLTYFYQKSRILVRLRLHCDLIINHHNLQRIQVQ